MPGEGRVWLGGFLSTLAGGITTVCFARDTLAIMGNHTMIKVTIHGNHGCLTPQGSDIANNHGERNEVIL